ncbi:hypothetical protein [Jatrophihabitans sp.]|uniref:hypothetical protein n=1 Tax=Jatrophihabitans sp. TaxID=1932789 RepID=UPI002EFF251B
MTLDQVREIADAVLYEGYLLYPYRASSGKNQSRWQFGVLGPPQASAASFSEAPGMSMQCLLRPRDTDASGAPDATVTIHLRFLQLQVRQTQRLDAGGYRSVDSLLVNGSTVLSWDEAVEREITLPEVRVDQAAEYPLEFPGGEDVEAVTDESGSEVGRIVRRRWPITARLRTSAEIDDGCYRLSVQVENTHPEPVTGKDAAIRVSLIGAHLLIQACGADFVSLLEPPEEAARAAARCRQQRCFPVLAGVAGSTDILLGAPIILYDYPEIAVQSQGALFDSTEIDEILTLRVMTMTEQEKAEARATDPRARAIIDRCDGMSPSDLQQLHGILRDPYAAALTSLETALPETALPETAPPETASPERPSVHGSPFDPVATLRGTADLRDLDPASFDTGEVPWWDPATDASVRPEVDAVLINGVPVSRGSVVRVHPSRRADAQDLFFADQLARVNAVLSDVDGNVHVALVLLEDPALDLHEWYGRYFYFAPEELEPMPAETEITNREESRS